jgi:hypothetical protein
METDDPVVIYDVMRECATRLSARYVKQITIGGPNDPAIVKMRALHEEIRAIDTRDQAEQRAKTIELRRRYAELAG